MSCRQSLSPVTTKQLAPCFVADAGDRGEDVVGFESFAA